MTETLRALTLWVAAVAIAAFGAAAVASYRPSGSTDRDAALTFLKQALDSLDDLSIDSANRMTAYAHGLDRTDALLRRLLIARPTYTAGIERLAAVRWEAGILDGGPDVEGVTSLMAIAAARAPRVPEIQAQLGELSYKMGRFEAATPFLQRAVELSPAMTNRIVDTMSAAGVPPQEILKTLPPEAPTLLALRGAFASTADWSAWLAAAEPLLPTHAKALFVPYTDACLASGDPARLLTQIEALGTYPDDADEAERQLAVARALLALQNRTGAAAAGSRALALSPADPRLLELVGQVADVAGDSATAERAFRDALGALARTGLRDADRFRLYRARGRALEKTGRVDEAFDEYRRALELVPEDPWLLQRFAATTPPRRPEGLK